VVKAAEKMKVAIANLNFYAFKQFAVAELKIMKFKNVIDKLPRDEDDFTIIRFKIYLT